MNASVTIIERDRLAHTPDGATRGYAHVGTPGHPVDAPGHLEFGPLLLFAEGEMRPGEGLPMHRHEEVENILLVRSGQLCHDNDTGGGTILGPGAMMVMSAGRGSAHSEFVYGREPVRALVIHLAPSRRYVGAAPRVQFDDGSSGAQRNELRTLASGRDVVPGGALPLRCDADLRLAALDPGAQVRHSIERGRRVYAIACEGTMTVNGSLARAGDRVLASGPADLEIRCLTAATVVLVDMG